MLMALGPFVFNLPTLAYSELQRSTSWRWPSSSRVGARAAMQFIGPGEDTIRLSGVLVPEVAGSLASLDQLRALADAGKTYAMVDGAGRVMGAWVIEEMTEGGSYFTPDGIARRTDFSLSLRHADDDQVSAPQPGDVPGATLATIDPNGGGAATIA
jgi:phage protein U